jgi:hypothetical protein
MLLLDSRDTISPQMKTATRILLLISFAAFFSSALSAQELKFANLGEFKLQSGEVLHDCRIGYRTFGKLNADASNAILFPTWAGGTIVKPRLFSARLAQRESVSRPSTR